jgi:phosphoglycolate phosphatase
MSISKYHADLLIFDLDGTLVDTRRDLANAMNYALCQLGKNALDLQTLTSYVGDGISKLLERALPNSSETDVETVRQHFRQFYFEHIADFSQPYSGMIEVLDHFAGKKKAVLTNKPQEFAEALLQRLGICKYFVTIIGGQPNLKLKPDPEAILKILNHLAILPARTIIIGDSENDIWAGKASGAVTCAVTYGFRSAEKLLALNPDFVIDEPQALKTFVI